MQNKAETNKISFFTSNGTEQTQQQNLMSRTIKPCFKLEVFLVALRLTQKLLGKSKFSLFHPKWFVALYLNQTDVAEGGGKSSKS